MKHGTEYDINAFATFPSKLSNCFPSRSYYLKKSYNKLLKMAIIIIILCFLQKVNWHHSTKYNIKKKITFTAER